MASHDITEKFDLFVDLVIFIAHVALFVLIALESCRVKNVLVLDEVLECLYDFEDSFDSFVINFWLEVATFSLFAKPLDKCHYEANNVRWPEEDIFVKMLHEDVLDFERFYFLFELKI